MSMLSQMLKPSTSGNDPTRRSTPCRLLATGRRSSQHRSRHSRRNRRRSDRLGNLHSLGSHHTLCSLRSRDNHRIRAQAARR